MYEHAFNLTSRPFTSAPYVKHYFPGAAIEGTREQCCLAIRRGSGPVVVVGGHGTGKTLLLAKLADEFRTDFQIVNVSASQLASRSGLLQNMLFELKQNYRGMDENELRLTLVESIKQIQSQGILLLVDDGQDLNVETAQEIQQLTNLVREGQSLVRVVVAGTTGLEERLADTRLAALNQRICVRCFLGNLSGEEVEAYVRAHIERADGNPSELFDDQAFRAIREVTDGCPRHINQVCDHAMIFAATRGQKPITDSLVRETWFDIQQIPGIPASVSSSSGPTDSSTVAGVKVAEDADGWTVLEFGSLDDDSEQTNSDPLPVETVEQPNFEAEQESAVPNPVTEGDGVTHSDAEDEQPALAPTLVELEGGAGSARPVEDRADQNTAEGTAVTGAVSGAAVTGVASGAAALAAAMAAFSEPQRFENANPNIEQNSQAPDSAEPQSEVVETVALPVTQPKESVPETQSNEGGYHYPQPDSSDEFVAPEPALVAPETAGLTPEPVEHAESPGPHAATPMPEPVAEAPVESAAVTSDPFGGDQFEDEEVLVDAYAPFVAKQNEKSMQVESAELSGLVPIDEVNEHPAGAVGAVAGVSDQSMVEVAAASPVDEAPVESFPTIDTAFASVAQPVREPAELPAQDLRVTEETRKATEANGPDSLTDEFTVAPEAGSVIPTESAIALTQVEIEPALFAPQSNVVPLDPNANSLSQAAEPVGGQANPVVVTAPPVEVTLDAAATTAHPGQSPQATAHPDQGPQAIDEPVDEGGAQGEVKGTGFHEQAPEDVSQEVRDQAEQIIQKLNLQLGDSSPVPPTPDSAELTQDTAAIEQTIQASVEQHSVAASNGIPQVVIPQQNSDESVAAGKQELDILEEVREQSAMVQGQPQAPEMPVSYQMPKQDQETPAASDDQDILNVARSETVDAPPLPAQQPMPEYAKQEPSTGSAVRVDYEKLFQQLRNIDQNQE